MDIESVEALLESGKAAAAAAAKAEEGKGDEGKSDRRSTRDPSPSGRSHTSSRSHRRSRRDRSRTPRGDRGERSRSRESRRRSHRGDGDEEDDRRSAYSSSSKRDRVKDRVDDDDDDEDEGDRDRKRRRSRSRSRSKDRHRSSRSHRDDDRERRRDRDRDHRSDRRDRDRDRDSRRSRDSSHDSRRRDDDRRSSRRRRDSRERARDSPRGDRDRRSRSPGRMTEEEHEMRSVFVSQLSARVGDRELFQFFETQVGKVRDARVILDRVSRRSKGVAYVEFFELEDVRKAIALSGTKLFGIPLLVQYTEAERNRQAGLPQPPPPPNVPEHISVPVGSDASGDSAVPWNRLYVGSLNFSLREPDIRAIFEPFGPIDVVDLHFDNITQKSKGYCFVQYRKLANAQEALEKMNGFEIAGRPIRVGLVTEKGSSNPNRGNNAGHLHPGQMANVDSSYQPGMRQNTGMQRPDSLEEGGASLNNISRIELMQKLARVEPPGGTLTAPSKPLYRVNVPTATSKSVLLKNMFNPAEETEPDWDTELRDDVKSECESKYGPVVEIYVEKESNGEIYVKFDTIESSTRAVTGLNGRWFGGSQVSAHFIPDAVLEAHRK